VSKKVTSEKTHIVRLASGHYFFRKLRGGSKNWTLTAHRDKAKKMSRAAALLHAAKYKRLHPARVPQVEKYD